MNKKKYEKPEILEESLVVDSEFALGCGSFIPASTVSCLKTYAFNEYEELVYAWGIRDDVPLDSPMLASVIFSNSGSCMSSCYQGPYDVFFAS